MFYPQFFFETSGSSAEDGAVIISSESMQLKSSLIMDENGSKPELVKSRRAITIENAQFFVVFKKDVRTKLQSRGIFTKDIPWPKWVPIECLVDQTAETDELSSIVKKVTWSIGIDDCNPLYLNQRLHRNIQSGMDGSANSNSDLEFVNSVFFTFPDVSVIMTSAHYLAVYDVFCQLILGN